MKNIGIITGGVSSERDISLRSAENISKLLQQSCIVEVFDFPKDLDRFLSRRKDIAVSIPMIHGRGGEDGTLQGFLETIGMPYLFSNVQAHAIALDKIKTKQLISAAGIHTPSAQLIGAETYLTYTHPVVVKPFDGGSSVATKTAHSQEELDGAITEALKYSPQVMVEDFIQGQEFTVAVVDVPGKLQPLPVILINAKDGFFDFQSKYQQESLAEEICPAPISQELTSILQRMAITAHKTIGCRHVSRSDMIVDQNGIPWFLEVNTIPGMTETSLLPKALMASGMSLKEILEEWLRSGC